MGTSVRRVLRLRTSPQSLVVAGFLARLPCDLRTWFPGPSRGSLLEPVWRFNLPLRARRNVRAGPRPPQRACPRTCSDSAKSYPRTCRRCGRSVDTLAGEVPRMGRLIARIIAAQDRWATPLGDFNHRWLSALFRPIRPLKDLLNGVWLGHPLHAAATDLPIGTLLLVVVLDLIGQPAAADIALVATILFMLGGGRDRRRRLHRHRRHRPRPGDDALDAHGRGAAGAARVARPAGREPDRPDDPDRAGDHRLPHRHRRRLHRRGRRVPARQHGQPPRLARGRVEVGPSRHRRRDRPGGPARGHPGQGQGRHQRHRPGQDRGHGVRAACRLRARRRPARAGHRGRRLHRVPVARLALPAGERARPARPALYDQPAYEIRAAEGGGYEVRRTAS